MTGPLSTRRIDRLAPRRGGRCAFALALLAAQAAAASAQSHPRLLLSREQVLRLQQRCGLTPGPGRNEAAAALLRGLQEHLAAHTADDFLPGELLGQAFLHQIEGDSAQDRLRVQLVASALKAPAEPGIDPLERVVALDWCWDVLDATARREILVNLRQSVKPLAAGDSPLDHRRFRERLAGLAMAIAIDQTDDPSPTWSALRSKIVAGAREFAEKTLPAFVEQRGLAPTGSDTGPREESDTALAIELCGRLLGEDLWPRFEGTVGRWLEHYVYAGLPHATRAPFARDGAVGAAATPAPAWEGVMPFTAYLIAARTRNPAAATIVDRVEPALHNGIEPLAAAFRWVPIVMDVSDVKRLDEANLPLARNMNGAIALRAGQGPDAAAIWIEATQPLLRRGQHLDAGHFLIYSGGRLAVSGGRPAEFEAVPAKGGGQWLGPDKQPFDFNQFCEATISHNAMIFYDPAQQALKWRNQPLACMGGQRTVDGYWSDGAPAADAAARRRGKLLAYGFTGAAAYVALDLAPAYEAKAVPQYTREFIFVNGRVLLVIDRATVPLQRITPTWVLNIPSRPSVDGKDLSLQKQSAGSAPDGGIWRYDDAGWLRWIEGDGAMWLRSIRPDPRRLAIVGGPARRSVVPAGPYAGRPYTGGSGDGFERLTVPSGRPRAQNAWFTLGNPTLLPPSFDEPPLWGRIEIEATRPAERYFFVTAMVIDRAATKDVPVLMAENGDGQLLISVTARGEQVAVVLPGSGLGGVVRSNRPDTREWSLPTTVMADNPFPTRD